MPVRHYLRSHDVTTAFEVGWSSVSNGELLKRAEESFDLIITTDQQLRYQQNLSERKIAVLVLLSTSWPRLIKVVSEICEAVERIEQGEYREIGIS